MPYDDITERDIADDLYDIWIENMEVLDTLDDYEPDDAEIEAAADALMGVGF